MRKADNLPPSCAVVTKSGNLNFLEPSGPLRACNGTALPIDTTDACSCVCVCVCVCDVGRAVVVTSRERPGFKSCSSYCKWNNVYCSPIPYVIIIIIIAAYS